MKHMPGRSIYLQQVKSTGYMAWCRHCNKKWRG